MAEKRQTVAGRAHDDRGYTQLKTTRADLTRGRVGE